MKSHNGKETGVWRAEEASMECEDGFSLCSVSVKFCWGVSGEALFAAALRRAVGMRRSEANLGSLDC